MTVLAFLLTPVVIVMVGSSVLAFRSRRPRGVTASVDSFRKEMEALAPRDDPDRTDLYRPNRHRG